MYLSKYSKYDTHFRRTDPWPEVPFGDTDYESDLTSMIGYVLTAFVLLCAGGLAILLLLGA